MNSIFTKGMTLVDDLGRERIFHGINFVYKGNYDEMTQKMNYIPNWSYEQFLWCKENGFNLIRLGLIWDGVEHEKGVYDTYYLNWIGQVLDWCEACGVYAYLDMHQDLYSCLYSDGAPKWATLTDDQPHVEGNLWSDAYLFSGAVQRAFTNFWNNEAIDEDGGVLDYYISMWSHVIKRFIDHPAVIGFDFLNEPSPGEKGLEIFASLLGGYAKATGSTMTLEEILSAFGDPTTKHKLLKTFDDKDLYTQMVKAGEPLVAHFDTTILQPFYTKMTRALRRITSKGIVMLENNYFSNLGIPCHLSPLTDASGKREPLQAYAPHGYDLVVDTPDIVYASNNRVDVIFDTHRQVQEQLNTPVIVGEWGAHSMYSEGLSHIDYLLNKFDSYKWSHTYWCYHPNIENAPVIEFLRRPYPQAICGEIIAYGYDTQTSTFTLSWQEGNPTSDHIIYLPDTPKYIDLDSPYTLTPIGSTSSLILTIPSIGHTTRQVTLTL